MTQELINVIDNFGYLLGALAVLLVAAMLL